MDHTRELQIVPNVKVDLSEIRRSVCICIFLTALPFIFLVIPQVRLQGDLKSRLLHDIQTAIPEPVPAPSMWVEHNLVMAGTSYAPVSSWNEGMFESFILTFPWRHQIWLFLQTALQLCRNLLLSNRKLWLATNNYENMRFIVFFVTVSLYSYLLVQDLDRLSTAVYGELRDNLFLWIESNVATVIFDEDFIDQRSVHPFTLGLSAPYNLETRTRYVGEDVVFVCEYNVTGDVDVEPDYVRTWWRRFGTRIETSDRHQIDISIESIDNPYIFLIDLRMYKIKSVLTIHMIQPSDYGEYTCDYINPMPMRIRVRPYFEENDYWSEEGEKTQPMSPHPKCNCQPAFPENTSLELRPICFSEFVLRSPATTTRKVKISPGGILISLGSYKTVSNMTDIKVDVTFEGNSDRKGNSECCSIFIKIYWALFRLGGFFDLPISRLMGRFYQNTTNQLVIIKYTCICRHSFGSHSLKFYRNHFNSTIKMEDEMEIVHPVELLIEPRDNRSTPLFEGFSFCSNSEQSQSTFCWALECLLDNSLYIFYSYDVFFVIAIVIIVISYTKFKQWSSNFIAKPLRRFCFHSYSSYTGPFPAVTGPPLHFVNRVIQMEVPHIYEYDIYLSYNEEDEYDVKIAKHLKDLLLQAHLSVFDPMEDILPGHVTDHESTEAIRKSRRFLVIASKSYTEDNRKKIEFVVIQDTIVSQDTKPKYRLLIVETEACDIVGLHRAPCIHVPEGMKEAFLLDQDSVDSFLKWLSATGPPDRDSVANRTFFSELRRSGFSWKSVVFLLTLLCLIVILPRFATLAPGPGEIMIIQASEQ